MTYPLVYLLVPIKLRFVLLSSSISSQVSSILSRKINSFPCKCPNTSGPILQTLRNVSVSSQSLLTPYPPGRVGVSHRKILSLTSSPGTLLYLPLLHGFLGAIPFSELSCISTFTFSSVSTFSVLSSVQVSQTIDATCFTRVLLPGLPEEVKPPNDLTTEVGVGRVLPLSLSLVTKISLSFRTKPLTSKTVHPFCKSPLTGSRQTVYVGFEVSTRPRPVMVPLVVGVPPLSVFGPSSLLQRLPLFYFSYVGVTIVETQSGQLAQTDFEHRRVRTTETLRNCKLSTLRTDQVKLDYKDVFVDW